MTIAVDLGRKATKQTPIKFSLCATGAQWLSGGVLDSRPMGHGFEPHLRHCVVSLSKIIYPSLVLVQPRKTRPYITERLLIGRKESNQTHCVLTGAFTLFCKWEVTVQSLVIIDHVK